MEEIKQNPKDTKTGYIGSMAVHAMIFLLLILPFCKYQDPPPGQEGVLVSFGEPNAGSSMEIASAETSSAEVPEEVTEPEEEQAEEQPEETKPEETTKPDKILTADNDAAAIRKQKEKEQKEAEQAAKEKRDKAKKKAAAEAKAAADAEAKRLADEEAKRNSLVEGATFPGAGRGENNASGNQGEKTGDPDASALKGNGGLGTKGDGMGDEGVGGGLTGRGVKKRPSIKENSNIEGKVRVDICVDPNGKVVSARSTSKLPTTITDSRIKKLAEDAAWKYIFNENPDAAAKTCGYVTFIFKNQ